MTAPATYDERCRRLAAIVADLDRCEHGRHEGDNCYECGGPSKGNPLLAGASNVLRFGDDGEASSSFQTVARQVGFDISGRPIVVPARDEMHDPEAWGLGR